MTKYGIIGTVIFDGSILLPACVLEYPSSADRERLRSRYDESHRSYPHDDRFDVVPFPSLE